MRRVSLIAAVFFAVAWLADAEDGAPPVPPQYTPRPVFVPTQSTAPRAISPDVTLVAPPLTPTAATWQIYRSESDTLLLNTAAGDSWVFVWTTDNGKGDGKREYKWQPIARLPVYGPPVPVPVPGATVPPQEGARPAARFFPAGDGERPTVLSHVPQPEETEPNETPHVLSRVR
jgi:hypothetical protein